MFLPVNLFIVLCIIVILVSIYDTCTQLCSILLCLSFSLPRTKISFLSLSLYLSLLFLVASISKQISVVDPRIAFLIPLCSLLPLSFQNRDTFSIFTSCASAIFRRLFSFCIFFLFARPLNFESVQMAETD